MKNKIQLIDNEILEAIALSFLLKHIYDLPNINESIINTDLSSVIDVSNTTSFRLNYYDFPYLNNKLDVSNKTNYLNYKDIFKQFDLDVNFYIDENYDDFLNKIINSSLIFTLRCCDKSKTYMDTADDVSIRFLTIAYLPENNKLLVLSDLVYNALSHRYAEYSHNGYYNQGSCSQNLCASGLNSRYLDEKDQFMSVHGPFSTIALSSINYLKHKQDAEQTYRAPIFIRINNHLLKLINNKTNLHKYNLDFRNYNHQDLDLYGECYISNKLLSQLINDVKYIKEIDSFNSIIHYKNLVLSSNFLNENDINIDEIVEKQIEDLKMDFDEMTLLFNNICRPLSKEELEKIKKGEI